MAEEAAAVEVSPTSLDGNKQLPTIFKYAAPQGTKEVFISGVCISTTLTVIKYSFHPNFRLEMRM